MVRMEELFKFEDLPGIGNIYIQTFLRENF